MNQSEIEQFVQRAEELYDNRLRVILEPEHVHGFVAIEPDSGDYYLGKTLSDAMIAARRSHPNRLAHAMRIGHKAALHFGIQVG